MTGHRLRHGEAVAIGMALDLVYSVSCGYLDPAVMEQVLDLLEAIGFDLWDDAVEDIEEDGRYTLLHGLQEFREHLGGELHITLLRDVGRSFEVTEMDEARVADAIRTLACRARRHAIPAMVSPAAVSAVQ